MQISERKNALILHIDAFQELNLVLLIRAVLNGLIQFLSFYHLYALNNNLNKKILSFKKICFSRKI
ncbi:hypothetical protein BpHYR1_054630 [Brachionus plicatilis]|uniref:Uncharacterized protein n=1 Tax=Brachionus plicatilis TaxID=10195 RepID=A0A3M7RGF5_BRAPC|nr:hypothetical protein BpHYR1_054630 [Brachionus plicatilis]